MLSTNFMLILIISFIAAPAPRLPPGPTIESLKKCLGKSHLGKEVRAIGRRLGEKPIISYDLWRLDEKHDKGQDDTGFYLIWKAKGLDMHFTYERLNAFWLFNDSTEEHKRYSGELPEGITFDDDREAIEKKLGKPTDVKELPARRILGKGPEIEEAWLDYTKDMRIVMRRPPEGKWAIHFIAFYLPDEEGK